MTGARMSTLADLRGNIERIESPGGATALPRARSGMPTADATLQGGLARGAMHEVFADAGRQSAAATGFVAGLAGRGRRGGRCCGYGRILPSLNRARCR